MKHKKIILVSPTPIHIGFNRNNDHSFLSFSTIIEFLIFSIHVAHLQTQTGLIEENYSFLVTWFYKTC